VKKRCGRVNMVQILCKWKNKTCWNYSKNRGREDKGEWWRGWIQVWCIWYIVRTFVNATMYPSTTIKNVFKKRNGFFSAFYSDLCQCRLLLSSGFLFYF
jgi:hypothetical protein